MLIGYSRTSTTDQKVSVEHQVAELEKLCDRVYTEEASALKERPVLEKVLDMLRPGDKLVALKLDRLARSVVDLGNIVKKIEEAGADLHIVNMGVDTSTPTGKLMLNVLGSVAQFEVEMMKERQAVGIAKAKAAGAYAKVGRKAKFSEAKARAMRDRGLSLGEIAHQLGVSRQAVHKKLA